MLKKSKTIFIFLFFISTFSFAQSISVTSPHSGDIWYKGHTYTITWTKSGNMDSEVKITLYKPDHVSLQTVIKKPTANSGSFDWTIPSTIPNGQYLVRVKTMDNAVYDDGDIFTIRNAPTTSITVINPHSGQTWCKGRTYTITWTKSGSMDSEVKITLYKPDHVSLQTVIKKPTANSGSYSWTIKNSIPDGQYLVRVKTMDNAVYGDGDVFVIKKCFVGIGSNTNYGKYGSGYKIQELPDLIPEEVKLGFRNWDLKIARFKVNIRNKGALDAHNIPLKLEIYKRGAPAHLVKTFTDSINFLPQGTYVTRLFDYQLPEFGTYDFIFKINPDHTVKEYKYSNNTSIRKSISKEKLPDLIVWLVTPKVDILSRSKIWIGVQNRGQKTSSPTKLKVYIQTKGTKYLDIPPIAPGHHYIAERKEWFHSLKDVWVEMWIDPYNNVREDKEMNNYAKTKLNVTSGL